MAGASQVNGGSELDILRQELARKNFEITQLKKENGELKDLLQALQRTIDKGGKSAPNVLLRREKLPAVSGESSSSIQRVPVRTKYPKSDEAQVLIREAIKKNDFLKNFDSGQVRELVECMKLTKFAKGQFIVREGWPGTELYITSQGQVEVRQKEAKLRTLSPGVVFGELAILYNCTRTATVVAQEEVEVWSLDRQTFQSIMMASGLERLESYKQFLAGSVAVLKSLSEEKLSRVADCLVEESFKDGEYIVREGSIGNTFYIVLDGKVEVTQRKDGGSAEEIHVRNLEKGAYFGELALQSKDKVGYRTANVIARQSVTCLALERASFEKHIGDLTDYQTEQRVYRKSDTVPAMSSGTTTSEYPDMRLEDLRIIGTLGVGGFGRVELVELKSDKKQTFALKCLKKKHIVETRQQEHIFNEKRIMMEVRCPFITRLYRSFRDTRFLYLLVEACLGGELWTVLRNKNRFEDLTARFYTACVVEAFEYLHGHGIIYRDLKPENLLLDSRGYVKLVDFGFAKRIGFGRKTWTFCGTPEYVPPEIILNKGHDFSADYWSLGILIFELLTGSPPFTGDDPMKTYNTILKGLGSVQFPSRFPRLAHSLIRKLCRDNPSERLGNQKDGIKDIKGNRWFNGFDWAGLQHRKLTPPILPTVSSPGDLSNFDPFEPNTELPAEDTSGWDEGF